MGVSQENNILVNPNYKVVFLISQRNVLCSSYFFKISNLTYLILKKKKIKGSYSFVSSPSKLHVGRCPQLDLKLSETRWSKYSEGRLQTSPDVKDRRVWANVLPVVDTNCSVKELT
jgi:hypothetical protein